ncbi:MAG TPA: MBOAT family O-acyltransferase [Flavobacterium sp.]|jgi:D-alanyl-lipoteichoic acid acyltransferase DltB (MBOAT superfamily)
MLFNSIEFALFLPVVFAFYWLLQRKLLLQNLLLLAASCFFYACWDWRFLFLLIISVALVYYPGKRISASGNKRVRLFWLSVSIISSIGFLATFKYYNFFVASMTDLMSAFSWQVNASSLNIILPVGISFYTFHGLSYILDLYIGKIEEEKSFVNYALFVSFFPLLVAGPIERATHLLPQIKNARYFDYSRAVDGLRQILWGLFKKMVIADNCAHYANMFFDNPGQYSGNTLALGAIFFAFQIYCDFSGYSDIALGTARLFGIELLRNFAFPYFSRDIAEFWRRWHISLTTWFRDYLYIPLGGSRGGLWVKIRNTFIIFLVSGLWHGANWTFVVWGLLNALYFLPLMLTNNNRNHLEIVAQGRTLPSLKELFAMLLTFGMTVFAWIFFRADTLPDAFRYIGNIFSKSFFSIPEFPAMTNALITILLTIVFVLIEWHGREQQYAIQKTGLQWKRPVRYAFYYCIIFVIFLFSGEDQQFIYFQF